MNNQYEIFNMQDIRFENYHEGNPEIYKMFKGAACDLLAAGHKHFGAKCIMEHLRFKTAARGRDGFKINNNYTSRYVRMLEQDDPRFDGFFTKRLIATSGVQ